jgi:hypothetical protein
VRRAQPLFQQGDLSVVLNRPTTTPDVIDIVCQHANTQRMVIDTFSDTDLGSLLPVGG